MLTEILVLVCLSVASFAATTDDCPSGLKRNEYLTVHDGTCYEFIMNERKTFGDAQDYCVNQGGQLAMAKSESVDKYLRDTLRNTYVIYYSPIWIGLKSQMDGYHWVDGTKMTYNNVDGGQDDIDADTCVALSPNRKHWSIFICKSSLFQVQQNRFVCQYPILKIETPTDYDCPFRNDYEKSTQVLDKKCYLFGLNNNLTFSKAETFCERYGGTLALIKSQKINDFVQSHLSVTYNLSSSAHTLWIGLKYSESADAFKWMDGSLLGYSNFFKYSLQKKGCGTISPMDGQWRKDFCTDYKFDAKHYICEYDPETANTTDITPTSESMSTPSSKDHGCPIGNGDYVQVLENKCYYFSLNESLKFQKAEEYCEKYGGTLAMPKSQLVNEFLQHHMHVTLNMGYESVPLWIGLKKKKSYYPYQWIDNSRVQYKKFKSKYPKGDCAAITPTDADWVSYTCFNNPVAGGPSKHFICEF